MKYTLWLLIALAPLSALAAFDPALSSEDHEFLKFLVTELPPVVLKRDPAELETLRAKLRDAAFANRNLQKPELEQALKAAYWKNFAIPAQWMITSSFSMLDGLEKASQKSEETEAIKALLHERRGLIEAAEVAYDTKDPKNYKTLKAIAHEIEEKDGKKLPDAYHRLRALYVPLNLAPAFPSTVPMHEPVLNVNARLWEHTMAQAKQMIRASKASASLPAPMRESFEKSLLDLFFTYKAPILDMKFRDVFESEIADKPAQPDPNSSEVLATLRSLLRISQLKELFLQIEKKGGMRQAVREIQPKVENIPGLCQRFIQLAHLKSSVWKKLRHSGKVILIDPGHLGGEFADDDRKETPPAEIGKESYGYREGHDTFVVAVLARKLLTQCAGYPEANVLIGRHGLHDEGGNFFNKEGDAVSGPPSPIFEVKDNLYFRKAELAAIKPDFLISIHADTSDTFTQHGMVITPRQPLTLTNGFFKTQAQYEASVGLANRLENALTRTMHSTEGMRAKTSCNDWIRFEYKKYYRIEMDLQIFRDFETVPSALIEGFDYASARIRELMNSVARGHRPQDPDVKPLKIDSTDFFFHTIHKCYAEGVALGAVSQILGLKEH